MPINRRDLIKLAAAAGSAVALGGAGPLASLVSAGRPISQQMPTGPAPTGGTTISLPTLPDGASLFYEIQGTGRPLLVLHGGLGLDHTYFQPWLDPLAQRLQLIYPDLRGNGRSSDVPVGEYTHEKMADDLDALRTALGIKQWAVLGHSYGGFIAQLYALKYPDTISYLILQDTSPGGGLGNAEGIQLLGSKLTAEQGAAFGKFASLTNDEEWKQLWYSILPLYFHDYDVPSLIANDKTVYRAAAIARTGPLLASYDTRSSISQLMMPTLVGVGRYDWVTPVRQSEFLYKQIAVSQMEIYEQSGHFPFIEEPGHFLDVVQRFLSA